MPSTSSNDAPMIAMIVTAFDDPPPPPSRSTMGVPVKRSIAVVVVVCGTVVVGFGFAVVGGEGAAVVAGVAAGALLSLPLLLLPWLSRLVLPLVYGVRPAVTGGDVAAGVAGGAALGGGDVGGGAVGRGTVGCGSVGGGGGSGSVAHGTWLPDPSMQMAACPLDANSGTTITEAVAARSAAAARRGVRRDPGERRRSEIAMPTSITRRLGLATLVRFAPDRPRGEWRST
jgi:hypothetical protein